MKGVLNVIPVLFITISMFQVQTFAENTDPESWFMEDFESYGITEIYDSNDILKNARPVDGDYSDTSAYPNGTASAYEGNAANNIAVKDCDGNDVYGGLPGWYGYLSGSDTQHNRYNRRLSVTKLQNFHNAEINNTKFLKIEPRVNENIQNGEAFFCRNNIDLEAYSFFTARVSISQIHQAGFGIIENLNEDTGEYDAFYNVIDFSKSENGSVNVYFDGEKKAEIALSSFKNGQALDWYTFEYRIFRNALSSRHMLLMVNDRTNDVIVNVGWTAMNSNSEFSWEYESKYGMGFYVNAEYTMPQTRMLVDDIKFTKDNFEIDFNSYNINTFTKQGVQQNILLNGFGGNENISEVYSAGQYQGNFQKNNYVYATIGTSNNPQYQKVFGNVPFIQGYMTQRIDSINKITNSVWSHRCNIVKADSIGLGTLYGQNQIAWLCPKTSEDGNPMSSYMGMESADFSDRTIWSTQIVLPEKSNGNVKMQLTKGRSITSANNAEATYDGNSHQSYFDVIEFDLESRKIIFNGEELGVCFSYQIPYTVDYTVDTRGQTPKHLIKITDENGTVLVSTEFTELSGFDFNGNIIGFRYLVNASAEKDSISKAAIRKIYFNKEFGADATGIPETVDLELNTNNVIKTVGREMYGINFEWGGQYGIYMTANNSSINPSYIDAFTGIVPIARAAGTSSQVIKWKWSIGDYSERENQQFWHWDPSILYYGPVEWIDSVYEMMDGQSKFIYAVNLPKPDGTGDSLEDIKDLVRFLTLTPDDERAVGSDGINWAQKRVDLGITDPVEIYAWEMGNELDAAGYSIDQYIEMSTSTMEAIRSIDPDAKISMHIKTNYAAGWAQWHGKILNSVGDDIDYLSVHYYYHPKTGVWGPIANLEADIKQITGDDRIKILVTEQASWRMEEYGDTFKHRMPHTMLGVLGTSNFYVDMLNYEQVVSSNYHSVYSSSWCVCWPDNGVVHRTAIADLIQIYNKYGVGNAVECSVNAPQIDVMAIKTESGVNLIITNRNHTVTQLDLGEEYILTSSAQIYADSYRSDRFSGYDDIYYIEDDEPRIISTFTLPANSVVALELSETSVNAFAEITGITDNTLQYKVSVPAENNYTIACALYEDNFLDSAILDEFHIFAGVHTREVSVRDIEGKRIKLMLLSDTNTLKPLCIFDSIQ